jgi:multidrug efflux pump subunit AcrA (membrane-fusion protein)
MTPVCGGAGLKVVRAERPSSSACSSRSRWRGACSARSTSWRVAQGRIVVSGRTKAIQPLETSVVTKVHVKDGDTVKAGQLLVELDATAVQADGSSVAGQLDAAEAEVRRANALVESLSKAKLDREQFAQQKHKSDQRSRLTQLTAPVDGTVQQLAVHTQGGVVTPTQVLMIVVPRDAEVTAEVILENKDVGFVQPGQTAEVKLETFPFTR